MAGDNEIQDRLMALFRDKLELEVPSAETDLMEGGMMDSLTFVELVFHIEKEFGVPISIDKLELEYFRSPASIVAFLAQMRSNTTVVQDV